MKHREDRGDGPPRPPERSWEHPRGGGLHPGEEGAGGTRGGRGRRPFDYGALRLMVLSMIAETPHHGYQLMRAIEERTDGRYAPSPGVIYPTLAWLDEMGFAKPEAVGGGRKAYRITDEGRSFLEANRGALEALAARGPRPDGSQDLRAVMHELRAALKERVRRADLSEAEHTEILERLRGVLDLVLGKDAAKSSPSVSHSAGASADSQTFERRTGGQQEHAMEQIITRHRFEIRRRSLTVLEKTHLTPHMIRIVLSGEDLADFTSLAPDDHIKLLFDTGAEKPEMREYTPRAFDPEARRLTIDFAVHDAGPATRWAVSAQPGDTLQIGGPRGSQVVSAAFDWWALIGDETALPAIGRWLGELPAGARAVSLGLVTGPEEEQSFVTAAAHAAHWGHRPEAAAADPAPALAAAAQLTLPSEGRGFIFIAAEAAVARALRDHFVTDRGHPREYVKAAGYWVSGQADTSDKSLD